MDQRQVLQKWIKQLQEDQIAPDALGLGTDRGKAIEKLRNEMNKLYYKDLIKK